MAVEITIKKLHVLQDGLVVTAMIWYISIRKDIQLTMLLDFGRMFLL